MKVVYVAGPYRAPHDFGVEQNIRRAGDLALEVWRLGAACICPHKNTAFFGGAADDQVWLTGDLEILRRCDAVLCTADWRNSKGAQAEVKFATKLRLPVFDNLTQLKAWLNQKRSAHRMGADHAQKRSARNRLRR